MEVDFADRRLQRAVSSQVEMQRAFGQRLARKLAVRIAALRAVDHASDLFDLPGRWHVLTEDWSGHLSADLVHPQRLLVRPRELPASGPSMAVDWAMTGAVTVVGIIDTH